MLSNCPGLVSLPMTLTAIWSLLFWIDRRLAQLAGGDFHVLLLQRESRASEAVSPLSAIFYRIEPQSHGILALAKKSISAADAWNSLDRVGNVDIDVITDELVAEY